MAGQPRCTSRCAEVAVKPLPLLPLRDSVLFPGTVMSAMVGRPRSVASVEALIEAGEDNLAVFAQKEADTDDPEFEDLCGVGTRAVLRRAARAGPAFELVLEGLERVRIRELIEQGGALLARVEPMPLPEEAGVEIEALHREVLTVAQKLLILTGRPVIDLSRLSPDEDPMPSAYMVAGMLNLDAERGQALLEAASRHEFLHRLLELLHHEVQVAEVRMKIASETRTELSDDYKKHLLRQQLRAIQHELGEDADAETEVATLREKLTAAGVPEMVRKETEREIDRMGRLGRASPDFQVARSYVDLVLELPWNNLTEDRHDLARARQVLDEDHFDLQEVKERILEHLAVMKLRPSSRAPILLFVGPPGVGKTSVGRSIARALGRNFERMSLGGMHDEAELRGHRRTYIGAMPGRILQALRRAGSRNPVLMLDEVDKVGRESAQGDPSAALMEVLDPEQNHEFRDNYLDLPFDLSRVFFLTTANTLDTIPRALLDRMEVLRLSGYSAAEKEHIARRFLQPRQVAEAGLDPADLDLPDEALRRLIEAHTREAGVRQLERALGRLARKLAVRVAEGTSSPPFRIGLDDLPEMLGPELHRPEHARETLPPGVAAGLAWTEIGGEVLYVEALVSPGHRRITLTGQLGRVMQESARAALSFVESHLGLAGREWRVHLHVPAGAVPKDGPSAGAAMAVALATAFTKKAARSDTAITGEVTLTGLLLPVGGLKEKVLAASRAGLKRVLLPRGNERDLRDIPPEIREGLEIVLVQDLAGAMADMAPDLH